MLADPEDFGLRHGFLQESWQAVDEWLTGSRRPRLDTISKTPDTGFKVPFSASVLLRAPRACKVRSAALFRRMSEHRSSDPIAGITRYEHYIGGVRVPPAAGAYFPSENPYTGEAWAEIARGDAADVDDAVAAARAALPGWAAHSSPRLAAALLHEARRPDRSARRAPGCHRGPRQRQALCRNVRADPLHRRVVPLLRRTRRQDRGGRDPAGQEGLLQFHPARAARRSGGHHALELAADAG